MLRDADNRVNSKEDTLSNNAHLLRDDKNHDQDWFSL